MTNERIEYLPDFGGNIFPNLYVYLTRSRHQFDAIVDWASENDVKMKTLYTGPVTGYVFAINDNIEWFTLKWL